MIPRQASQTAIAARRRWLVVSRGIQVCVFLVALVGVVTVWKRHFLVAGGGTTANQSTSAAQDHQGPVQVRATSTTPPDAAGVQASAGRGIMR